MENQAVKKGNRLVIYTLFAATAVLWGMSFLWIKVALDELEVMELLAVRWTLAAVLFGVLIAAKVLKADFRGKSRKFLLLGAFVQPCIYALMETWGVDYTTSSVSSIFIAVIPLVVVLLNAAIFKAEVSRKTTFAIVLAFSGVIISVVLAPDFAVGGRMLGYLCLMGAVADGESIIEEKVFEKRFLYAEELRNFNINTACKDNELYINESRIENGKAYTCDLRGGAALVGAALAAEGESVIFNIEHIDRGYENFVDKLKSLGANIMRVDE